MRAAEFAPKEKLWKSDCFVTPGILRGVAMSSWSGLQRAEFGSFTLLERTMPGGCCIRKHSAIVR
jgi:hypothetical protein